MIRSSNRDNTQTENHVHTQMRKRKSCNPFMSCLCGWFRKNEWQFFAQGNRFSAPNNSLILYYKALRSVISTRYTIYKWLDLNLNESGYVTSEFWQKIRLNSLYSHNNDLNITSLIAVLVFRELKSLLDSKRPRNEIRFAGLFYTVLVFAVSIIFRYSSKNIKEKQISL